jgi:hypothetical protein
MNFESFNEAIAEKDGCRGRKTATLKKLATEDDALKSLKAGKFSFKTMMKSMKGTKED